ncbi:hypothetical protein CAOG_06754 [Capsaspora owczarzaki ATCC 30864]|uniref:VPS37 C-terminal domain-containing protein n=1 Tax=Capsaspora owczarzaki (strain ATCC 30864) TaxID=595528 RepID=A0A0D2X4P6_CAPO3|nr:hypothetical protein CAOG_06754 [Capsaspora owczarzaki ATCC 30864]KJE96424.1 hypothetical protein CAOG_006754 [Capsaspora owczarzaki ATCC 30864]|eukprot:XP_004344375.1 hypothetical protein CAOG_06754 [Capsaspora owczarzaki ATCC 30864]
MYTNYHGQPQQQQQQQPPLQQRYHPQQLPYPTSLQQQQGSAYPMPPQPQYPSFRSQSPASMPAQPQPSGSSSSNSRGLPPRQPTVYHDQQSQIQTVGVHTIYEQFPDLKAMTSLSELNALLEDEQLLDQICSEMPMCASIAKARSDLLAKNHDIAQQNLALEPRFIEQLSRLAELHTELANKKQQYDALFQEQQEASRRFSTDALLQSLKVAATEADSQSEALAEQLRSGECSSVDDFVRDYQGLRRLYHERSAKIEKLQHLKDHQR